MDIKTHKYKPGLISYTEESEIHQVLNIPILLNTFLNIKEEEVTIITKDTTTAIFLKSHLRENLQRIKEYFGLDIVRIVVEEQNGNTEENQLELSVGDKIIHKGNLTGQIKQEYLEFPYIIGEPNKLVYNTSMNFVERNDTGNNIIYVYGAPGTGKSHLFHILADKALKAGRNVYLDSSINFTEQVKKEYLSKEIGKKVFLERISKNSFIFIEDIHQIKNARFMEDIIFEVLNYVWGTGGKFLISADQSPAVTAAHYNERVSSRLMAGFCGSLNLPDDYIKERYIDLWCEKKNIQFHEDVKRVILTYSTNLRIEKAVLYLAAAQADTGQLDAESLMRGASAIYGDMSAIRKDTTNVIFAKVFDRLREHYAISLDMITNDQGKRRPKPVAALISVMYYLFYDKQTTGTELRKKLNISKDAHTHYMRAGKEHYKNINNIGILSEINMLVEQHRKNQGGG